MQKTTDFFKPRFHLFSNVKSVIYLWWFNISSLLLLKRKGTRLFKPRFYLSIKRRPFYLQKCDSFECFFFISTLLLLKRNGTRLFRPRFYLYVNRFFCFWTAKVWFFWMVFYISTVLLLKRKVTRLFRPRFYLSVNRRLFYLFSNSMCDSFEWFFIYQQSCS